MSDYVQTDEYRDWVCARCNLPLELKPVQINYLGSGFQVKLPCCPSCGNVFIPESLVNGKMAEVERSLEDK